jgi:hypothetical protein
MQPRLRPGLHFLNDDFAMAAERRIVTDASIDYRRWPYKTETRHHPHNVA